MATGGDRLVSVMVPVYNAAAYIGEAMDSVLAQTYGPVELVVYDDGSTDGSGDVAKQYGSAVKLMRGDRVGLGAGRNNAIRDWQRDAIWRFSTRTIGSFRQSSSCRCRSSMLVRMSTWCSVT